MGRMVMISIKCLALNDMKNFCILLASGVGSRFGADMPKQFLSVCGKTVLEYTLASCDCGLFDQIILVVSAPHLELARNLVQKCSPAVPVKIVTGGKSRRESFENGMLAINATDGYVVVHNAAQPFVRRETFSKCLETLHRYPAAVSVVPCTYTIMNVDAEGCIKDVPDRAKLVCDMGEEGFRLGFVRSLLKNLDSDMTASNLIGLVVSSGAGRVGVFEGDPANFKITYQADLKHAEERICMQERQKE